jgi:hypothetical protein
VPACQTDPAKLADMQPFMQKPNYFSGFVCIPQT